MSTIEREDYFFELTDDDRYSKILVLIIYDIVDNRKRTKFAKHLQGYGTRVQKSAFEAKLTKKKYEKLLREIPFYCSESDSVRIYKIIGKSQVKSWGVEINTNQEDIIFI